MLTSWARSFTAGAEATAPLKFVRARTDQQEKAMSQPDISLFASLRAAYDASRAVRSPEDLVGVLENVAGIVSENLGWRGVAIHVHRRAWDDFEATVVHCGDETCDLRLGARREWREW